MKFKYINCKQTGVILWPHTDLVWHKHVANAAQQEDRNPVLSAGFADIANGKVRCYGRSDSLGIASAPHDSEVIAEMLDLEAV